jgi:ribonuclease-3
MQANSDYSSLLKKLSLRFNNPDLLNEAFTHKSFVNEVEDPSVRSNERLEFLGDAVLELVITKHIFQDYPDSEEGELTAMRSALVRGKNLSTVARNLELGQYLILSKGEFNSKGQNKGYILANLVEAVIGAIYLDQGMPKAAEFILKNIYAMLPDILAQEAHIDSKTKFQELSQEKLSQTPEYKLIKEFGPDHSKKFTMGAFLNNNLIAEGTDSSKQKAEQIAARNALKEKGWN